MNAALDELEADGDVMGANDVDEFASTSNNGPSYGQFLQKNGWLTRNSRSRRSVEEAERASGC
ncbi:MAG: hypothetical protein U5J64_02765 [Halobacteriales archaeon]|nr:hypothetical protein [Halobacteriales archaeon]